MKHFKLLITLLAILFMVSSAILVSCDGNAEITTEAPVTENAEPTDAPEETTASPETNAPEVDTTAGLVNNATFEGDESADWYVKGVELFFDQGVMKLRVKCFFKSLDSQQGRSHGPTLHSFVITCAGSASR